MKQYFLLAVLSVLLLSCGGRNKSENIAAGDAQTLKTDSLSTMELKVDAAASEIRWKGFKPGGGHHGTLSLKEGVLNVKDDVVVGGRFVIDMNSIVNEDLEGDNNQKLVSHLKSADFFDVAQYPLAEFVITAVATKSNETFDITGNLTMKGVTRSITFPATITTNEGKVTASAAPFTIDRVQWGVNYGSKNVFKNLKDSFINDEMEVEIKITAE